MYSKEQQVIDILNQKVLSINKKNKASIFSIEQNKNSITRETTFKIGVAIEDAPIFLETFYDIGTITDRELYCIGSKIKATDTGEIHYLLFVANITPQG